MNATRTIFSKKYDKYTNVMLNFYGYSNNLTKVRERGGGGVGYTDKEKKY